MPDEHLTANPHDHDEVGVLPPAPHYSKKALTGFTMAIGVVLAVAFAAGFLPRIRRIAALENETMQAVQRTRVQTTKPALRPASGELSLPGTVQPLADTTIYARTNGYLRRWLVDIGDKVHTGQLLAEIDVPEVDDQLRGAQAAVGEAKAAVEQARTQLELAKLTLKRVVDLAATGYSSQQERDERQAAVHVEEANEKAAIAKVATQEAEIARLTQLKAFSNVTAPFAGTITLRNTEVGSLVMAGTGSAQALFHLAKSNIVRVFVSVPQSQSAAIHQGQEALITVHNMPDSKFKGVVTRTSNDLSNTTHTLLTEVDIHNETGGLLPGMFVDVRFSKITGAPKLTLPANAVLYNAQGTLVATVDSNEKIHLQQVQLGEDYGTEIAVLAGISADDRIVLNPSDKAVEGLEVSIQNKDKASGAASN